jgi:hypothetical protein
LRDCAVAAGVRHPLLPSQRVGVKARVAFGLAGALVLLAAVAVVLLFTPLASGVVTPQIVKAIQARLGPGYSVRIGESHVDPTREGLDLRLDDFEVLDSGGNRVFAVPSASLAVDSTLLTGGADFPLRRIKLVKPHLTLRVEESGAVGLATSDSGLPLFSLPGIGGPQPAPTEIIKILTAADATLSATGQFGKFQVAEVVQGNIVLDDQRRKRVDRLDNVNVRIARAPKEDGLIASASSASEAGRWSLTATLGGKTGQPRNFDLGFDNLPLGRLIYEALRGATPADFDGGLAGHLYAQIDAGGAINVAGARLDVTNFQVISPVRREATTTVERGRVEVEWNGAERRLRLVKSDVFAGTTRVSLGGEARPLDDAYDGWSFQLGGTEMSLPGTDAATQALRFDRIEFSGSLERAARRFKLDNASLRGRALSVAGQGTFDFSGSTPVGDIAIASSRGPLAALLRVWPVPIAPSTRTYLSNNVPRAMIDEMTLAVKGPLAVGPSLDRSLRLDAKFSDGVLNYLDGAPPALDVSGTLMMRDRELLVALASGHVDAAPGQTLSIAGTQFSAPDHRPDNFPGEIAVRLDGPMAGVGQLLAIPKVSQLAPGAAPLFSGGGKVNGTVFLRGLIGPQTEMAKLALSVDADVHDVSMPRAVGGRDLQEGDLHLTLDQASAAVRGQARISGAPVAVEAVIARNAKGEFGQTSVAFSVDPAKIKDFGADSWKISGPVSARLSMTKAGVFDNATFEADLTGSVLSGPLGMKKGAGQPGRASFSVMPKGTGWQLNDFQAQGGGIDLKGALEVGPDGLVQADLSTFRASVGDDARLKVSRAGNNGYKVSIQGSSFNGQAALKEVFSGETAKDPLDIDLDAKLGTVVGNNGETLTGLDLRISRRANTTRSFHLAGQLGGGSLEGRSSGDDVRLISVRSGDAGAMLRFLDIYNRVGGGALTLDVAPGDITKGRLRLQNFQVIGDQQLASVAHGPRSQARGMNFIKMDAKFSATDGRIQIDDCVVYGNELGATLSGEINYAANQVGIRGTFLPAYAINNLFGKLPLIGTILGGGSKEGLLGITFELEGPWTAPAMKVNPLSAVAPGFLRKLFEFREKDAPTPAKPAGRSGTPG